MLNLLEDRAISLSSPTTQASLPEVLAQLSAGNRIGFPHCEAHQQQAWHQFLVQVAVAAQDKCNLSDLTDDPATWRTALLGLTAGTCEPWSLIVEDLAKPAFLQPPIPERSLTGFKGPFRAPDAIDVLITAKNHDLKSERIRAAAPDHWLFALLTLQTQQGFLGAGNYGISRMNGGFASRPLFGYAPGIDPTARFRHDVAVFRKSLGDVRLGNRAGPALLWLDSWNDSAPYSLERLHPAFIEICRRVRLVSEEGRITALTISTKASRVAAKELKGHVGDPWIPIDRAEGNALTVSGRGFHYTLLSNVLFSADFDRPACMMVLPEEEAGSMALIAQVLVRGQGITEGLHRRVLPIPKRIILRISRERAELGALAKKQINLAEPMPRLLRRAVCIFLQGAPAKPDFTDRRADSWRDRYDRAIDDQFFKYLWGTVEENGDPLPWQVYLRDTGRHLLNEALAALPTVCARRYRALTATRDAFESGWRRDLPNLADKERQARFAAAQGEEHP